MSEKVDQVFRVARAFQQARQSGIAVAEDAWVGAVPDADTAYAVQDKTASLMGWAGPGSPSYWKGGAPNTQSAPVISRFPAAGVHTSPASRAWAGHFIVGVEAEIAFRLGRDLSLQDAMRVEATDIPSLLDAMTVSIELVDSRWKSGMAAPALLLLADLQAHGALVLGPWVPLVSVDWQRQRCSVRVDGIEQGPYVNSHRCGDPLWVVPSCLRHAASRDGVVPAGTVITTGSWSGIVWLQGPAEVQVAFEGIGEARLVLT